MKIKIEMFPSVYAVPVYENDSIKYFVGTDAEIVRILQAALNATVSVIYQPFDPRNFDTTGAINRLQTKQRDLIAAGYFIREYQNLDIVYTDSIYSDRLCCVVPKAPRIPRALLPLVVFEPILWMALLLCVCVCAGCWCALRRISIPIESERPYSAAKQSMSSTYTHIFIDTFILMMSAPLKHLPRPWSERIFITSVCFVSIVVIAYFISFLATVFVTPIFYEDMNTLLALDKSKLRIKVTSNAIKNDTFQENSSLAGKVDVLISDLPLAELVAQGAGFAAASRIASLRLQSSNLLLTNQLHVIPECPRSYRMAYIARSDFEFLPAINEILLRLLQSGLIEKWMSDMYYNTTLDHIRIYGAQYVGSYKVFTLGDMEFPFIVWFICMTLSFVVFCVELLLGKSAQWRK